jgi:ABC-type dipeptide/oligopeptide/nickel transport system permease component
MRNGARFRQVIGLPATWYESEPGMSAYFFRRAVWLLPIMLVVVLGASLLLQVAPWDLWDGQGPVLSAWQILAAAPENGSAWQSPLGNSTRLLLGSEVIGLVLGVPVGLLAALRRGSWLDEAIQALCGMFISLPGFVLAGLVLGGIALQTRPSAALDWERFVAWLPPAMVLSSGLIGYTARFVREALMQAMRQDYARSARAKGLSERAVVARHLLRNALIPVASALGPALAGLVVGSLLVEAVFRFPGMGQVFVQGILQGDRGLILSGVVVYAFLAALASLGADLLAAVLDPRLRGDGWR